MPSISSSDIIVSSWENKVKNNFNGKEKIKYYIHDSTGWQYNLNINPGDFTLTFNHYTGEENYIDFVFNSIDPYISLDFEKTYSASEGDIDIYMLGNWSSPLSLGITSVSHNKTAVYWYATNIYNYINYGTLKDNDAYTLIHEIGHAIGLSHPQLNGLDDPYGNWHDSNDTVMSYNYISSSNASNWSTIDIQALQNIWGSEDNIAPLITGPSGSAGAENSQKTINENTTEVHTFSANETVTWSIHGGNDPTFFSINSTTGQLTFNNPPDFENKIDSNTNGIYSIYVKATDSTSNSSTQWVEVTVADVDEIAPNITGPSGSAGDATSTKSIDENTTAVHTFSANETVTWSLNGGADASKFSINSSTGALTFSSAPNYESPTDTNSDNDYIVVVRATDSIGNTSDQTATISINGVNETPTNISLSSSSFNENIASSSTVATLSSSDPDTSDTHTYSLVSGSGDTDNNSFTIDGSSLKINSSPDYETQSSYTIRLKTTDGASNHYEKSFSLSVNDLEEGDTEKPIIYGQNNLIISSSSTAIDIPEGTSAEIYRFTANEEVTWSISQSAGINDYQYFSIDEVTGSLKINGDLDYENPKANGNNNLYILSINATDTSSNKLTQTFNINITNVVDESITIPDDEIPATSTELQQLYIGYFGRPCDPDGLDYWLGDKVTRKSFAENMYVQPEFNSVNGNLSTRAQVNQMYLNLFNRDGDDAGLDYWSGQVESGILELASIANDLTWAALNNAGSEVDKKTLTHKTNAAIQYTYEIRKSNSDKVAYQPDSTNPWVTGDNLTEGKTFINEIGYSKVATLTEIQTSIGKFNSTSSRYQVIPSDDSQSRIDPITGIPLDNLSNQYLENERQTLIPNITNAFIPGTQEANEDIKYISISDHLSGQQSITHIDDDILYIDSEIQCLNDWIGKINSSLERKYNETLLDFFSSIENQSLNLDTI